MDNPEIPLYLGESKEVRSSQLPSGALTASLGTEVLDLLVPHSGPTLSLLLYNRPRFKVFLSERVKHLSFWFQNFEQTLRSK